MHNIKKSLQLKNTALVMPFPIQINKVTKMKLSESQKKCRTQFHIWCLPYRSDNDSNSNKPNVSHIVKVAEMNSHKNKPN